MAIGKLGSANLGANTPTLLFTAAIAQVFNIRFANATGEAALVSVALSANATPGPDPQDYITKNVSVATGGVLEDTAIAISAGEHVWVKSDTSGVSVRAHGV